MNYHRVKFLFYSIAAMRNAVSALIRRLLLLHICVLQKFGTSFVLNSSAISCYE